MWPRKANVPSRPKVRSGNELNLSNLAGALVDRAAAGEARGGRMTGCSCPQLQKQRCMGTDVDQRQT